MNDATDCWDRETLGVSGCQRCSSLVESRSQIVDGVGPTDTNLLFVGEAPGANEDEQGEPFVGRSGTVLDTELRDAGIPRADVRITNCVRCRPPENRDPTVTEREHCRTYLNQEITAVDPELVVTLGKVPAEHLLDRSVAVTSEAGNIDEIDAGETSYPVLICVHPAATLYDPNQSDVFEKTLRAAAEHAGDGGQSALDEF
ncbi:uracil-DNA glycosylase family protein [Halovenus rubra]|uniref:Uracil-DNA glycosylase family protein n=2 Tax=Halovenus rubra TaxID=869890 RepID=A0ACC7E301_9EURY|nr:uracil-DNA glycosylase [Halovenus rubra]